MPPKIKKTPAQIKAIKRFVSKIDAKRHEAKIKEIEEKHKMEAVAAVEEELEEELEEEEMSEEEIEEVWSEYEWSPDLGRIDLSFPETTEQFAESVQCYPPSYYTLCAKERVLLLYAENFRRQFMINYPKHRPLVLAVPNECNVQKFVCTTIRPMAFNIKPLIGSLEECASFVADAIIYEPLPDMMSLMSELKPLSMQISSDLNMSLNITVKD